MSERLSAAKKRRILELAAKGLSQRDIAKQAKTSLASVNRAINERVAEQMAPAATATELRAMSPADRLESQLSTLDNALADPKVAPAIRMRALGVYANYADRISKMRAREGKGERQFDGLADLILSAAHADSTRWSTDPADWLADAIPRILSTLHEIAGALERVPADQRKASAERMRPLLHRLLAVLDAP